MGRNIPLCSSVKLCASLLVLHISLIVLSLPWFSKGSSDPIYHQELAGGSSGH